jgi:hypothetical protein
MPKGFRGFQKGVVTNPLGRPKEPEGFKELVRSYTLPALKVVYEILIDVKAKKADRLKAAEIIIERAYGKAIQPIIGEDGKPLMSILVNVMQAGQLSFYERLKSLPNYNTSST